METYLWEPPPTCTAPSEASSTRPQSSLSDTTHLTRPLSMHGPPMAQAHLPEDGSGLPTLVEQAPVSREFFEVAGSLGTSGHPRLAEAPGSSMGAQSLALAAAARGNSSSSMQGPAGHLQQGLLHASLHGAGFQEEECLIDRIFEDDKGHHLLKARAPGLAVAHPGASLQEAVPSLAAAGAAADAACPHAGVAAAAAEAEAAACRARAEQLLWGRHKTEGEWNMVSSHGSHSGALASCSRGPSYGGGAASAGSWHGSDADRACGPSLPGMRFMLGRSQATMVKEQQLGSGLVRSCTSADLPVRSSSVYRPGMTKKPSLLSLSLADKKQQQQQQPQLVPGLAWGPRSHQGTVSGRARTEAQQQEQSAGSSGERLTQQQQQQGPGQGLVREQEPAGQRSTPSLSRLLRTYHTHSMASGRGGLAAVLQGCGSRRTSSHASFSGRMGGLFGRGHAESHEQSPMQAHGDAEDGGLGSSPLARSHSANLAQLCRQEPPEGPPSGAFRPTCSYGDAMSRGLSQSIQEGHQQQQQQHLSQVKPSRLGHWDPWGSHPCGAHHSGGALQLLPGIAPSGPNLSSSAGPSDAR